MCVEHIEDGSSLYDIVKAGRRGDDMPWTELMPFEDRIEAHVDALVIGGETAWRVCQERMTEGDPGELFAATSVICRRGEAAAMSQALRGLSSDAIERADALGEALIQELPAEWEARFVQAMGDLPPHLQAVVARVAGGRRLAIGSPGRLLERATAESRSSLLRAIGRSPGNFDLAILDPFYREPPDDCRVEALMTGLRHHDPRAVDLVMAADGQVAATLPLVGLAGGRGATRLLLAALEARPCVQAVFGLGLLGDPSVVRTLQGLLANESLGMACAQALYVITGAAPYDVVREVEPVAEDELFDKELAAWRTDGSQPKAADGLPYGLNVRRLSRDPEVWGRRLAQIATRFVPSTRYRFGHPCTADVMLKGLRVPDAPPAFRRWFFEELAVRHGLDVATESDAPVRLQYRAMMLAADQLAEIAPDCRPGLWYLGGQVVAG